MPPVASLAPAHAGHPAGQPLRRRSGAAAVIGVGVGVALIWGSLAALNRFVLGFHAWPQAPQVAAQRLVVDDVVTAPGSAQRAGAVRLLGGQGVLGAVTLVPGGAASIVSGTSTGAGLPTAGSPATSGRGGALPAPGVSGGVRGPAGGTVSKSDPDGDGIPTTVEQQLGTNPQSSDTDGDGVPDGTEQANGTNPLNASDGTQAVPTAGSGTGGATPAGTTQGFTQENDPASAGKDPAASVGDPQVATDGSGTGVADAPATTPAEPDLGTSPADPATPADSAATPDAPPVATTPAPDPVPAPDPTPAVDPVTAPEPPADPAPVEAPPTPAPDTGGVAAPAETPPVTAT